MLSDDREPTDGADAEALSLEAGRMRSAIEARLFHADVVPVRVGRFVVLDVIGRGGMGIVYRAYDPRLERHVAVKVLHAGRGASMLRLEREAQALARLNHPNVVTIHEVGDAADGIFVAMELVEGGTLEHWCRELAPSGGQRWRRLVAFALQACEGLAAAHRAGLVHRDLKPANILVGADGRVRIADFGLAATERARALELATSGDEVHEGFTETGAIVGTLAYMAPEQLDGHADAKSDQFGLCAALYEAFFGERPFPGGSITALRESIAAGPRKPPPSRVPDFVTRALMRGLATDPKRRFPDVDALCDALRRGSRRRTVAFASAIAGTAVAIAATLAAARETACAFATEDLGDAWSATRRAAVHEAFAASPSPAAAVTLERVEARIDRAAHSWVATRGESCEAARRKAPLADARIACLESARDSFAELTSELTRADDDLVVHAIDVAELVGDVVRCDESNLDAHGSDRGRELVARLRAGRVAKALTHFDEARVELAAVIDGTSEGEFPRLRAEASSQLAAIANLGDEPSVAAEHASRALDEAERTGDPDFIARCWAMLGSTLDHTEAPDSQIAFIFERARRHAARGVDELVRADIDWKEGGHLARTERCADAKPLFARAAEIFAAHESPHQAIALLQLGQCEVLVDTPGAAFPTLERALASAQAIYGPDHPEVASYYGVIGEAHGFALDEEAGVAFHERALAIYEAHPHFEPGNRAGALVSLGISQTHLGRDEEAIENFHRAIEVLRGIGRTTGPLVSDAWHGIASAQRILGRYDEALAACDAALAASGGPDPIGEYQVALLRAKILVAADRRDEASVAIDEAYTLSRDLHDVGTVRWAAAARDIGGVLTSLGRYAEARAQLERVLVDLDPGETGWHAAIRLQLARTSVAAGDGDVAREHIAAAKRLLDDGAQVKPDVRDGIAEMLTQLGDRPPSSAPSLRSDP